MNVNKMTLPYPVLGVNDDILPNPKIIMDENQPETTDSNYIFCFNAYIENEKISALINDGVAEYVCEIECARTYLRRCFKQSSPNFKIEIPINSVNGHVSFQVTVTLKTAINNYYNEQFHEDYRGYTFNLEKGDLLANVGYFTFDTDVKYDNLHAVSAFMSIVPGYGNDKVVVDLSEDKIKIKLPVDMYYKYQENVRNNDINATIIQASLVINALFLALYKYTDHTDCLWARSIRNRILREDGLKKYWNNNWDEDEEIFDPNDINDIAQTLLDNPFRRLLNSFNEINHINEISED